MHLWLTLRRAVVVKLVVHGWVDPTLRVVMRHQEGVVLNFGHAVLELRILSQVVSGQSGLGTRCLLHTLASWMVSLSVRAYLLRGLIEGDELGVSGSSFSFE